MSDVENSPNAGAAAVDAPALMGPVESRTVGMEAGAATPMDGRAVLAPPLGAEGEPAPDGTSARVDEAEAVEAGAVEAPGRGAGRVAAVSALGTCNAPDADREPDADPRGSIGREGSPAAHPDTTADAMNPASTTEARINCGMATLIGRDLHVRLRRDMPRRLDGATTPRP